MTRPSQRDAQPPAPERPAGRGLPLDVRVQRVTLGGQPKIRVFLQRLRYPRRGPAFAPLRLPERSRIVLQDCDSRLLHKALVQFQLQLVPGSHRLPLTNGEPFVVEIAEQTRATGQLELGPLAATGAATATTRGASSETVVRGVEVLFEPPLELPHVLGTLREVQHLFDDRRFAGLLQRWATVPGLETARSLGFVARTLGGHAAGGLRDQLTRQLGTELTSKLQAGLGVLGEKLAQGRERLAAAQPGVVLLSRVLGRLRENPQRRQPELELLFSGHIRWLDRVTTPFSDIALPAMVLPVPHASLDRLLSSSPLASGGFQAQRFTGLHFLRGLLDSLRQAEGRFSLECDVPPLEIGGMTVDRTGIEVTATLPGALQLHGTFVSEPQPSSPAGPAEGDRGASLRRLRWSMPELSLGFGEFPDHQLEVDARGSATLDLEPSERPWARRLRAALEIDLRGGSQLPSLGVQLRSDHPLALGETTVRAQLSGVRLEGGLDLAWEDALVLLPARRGLSWSCNLSVPEQPWQRRPETLAVGSLEGGSFAGALEPAGEHTWRATLRGQTTLRFGTSSQVTPIAELKIEDSTLRTRLQCGLDVNGAALVRFVGPLLPEITVIPGGRLRVTLQQLTAELDGRRLEFPPALLVGTVRQAELAPTGNGDFALDVTWTMHGKPCLLHGRDRTASLLTRSLREGELTLHVSPGGRVFFSGEREGLYGVRFFNSLLKPASDPGHLLQLLGDDNALGHVVAALEVFNPELAETLSSFRELALATRTILTREGIRKPADVIPRARMARLISLLLVGTDRLAPGIQPLIQGITEGRGLDVAAAKKLLREPLAGFQIDYELDGLLRWFDLVVRPSEPVPPPEAEAQLPLAEDPRYAAACEGLPAAEEIYRHLARPRHDPDFLNKIMDLAPELSLAQVDYLLSQAQPAWPPEVVCRLSYVGEVKRRVAQIAEGYGGLAYTPQDLALASFLGEALGPLPGLDGTAVDQDPESWPPPCTLGPEEVGVLLQAGLAAGRQGLQAQIHNRLLIELVRSRPGSFLAAVLVELGCHSHRALAGVLFSFFNQDQDRMKEPVNLHRLVEEKLGLPVPRQEEYLAGGRRARDSYYAALTALAEAVFDRAGPYLARRAYLREVRQPVPPAVELGREEPTGRLAAEAALQIERADELGRQWLARTDAGPAGPTTASEQVAAAYEQAFAACRLLLAQEPRAYELPWLRDFWGRSEEALRVLSVVRNHQQDVDDVRHWLEVAASRLGLAPGPADEQELLATVVRVLYPEERDRQELLADPLVRLLLDPPEAHYRFTVITCMGVITDGIAGRELEDAFRRLHERRGVRLIRAGTGLWRSLEYNAEQILAAIEQTETPWGYIGYSQGCANGLLAESILRGGTPAQQQRLAGLVGRQLLFSAANGSAHGTSGARKFVRALIEGERFLKHYQASFTREAVDLAFRGMKAALDSDLFLKTLGGTFSLGLARARWLHRDGQFAPWAPTVTTRGIVTPERLPESLEYLYYVLRELTPGSDNDSQITVVEGVGHATRVTNPGTEAFARQEIPSRTQATHHWSPLTAEVELVTTERDRERAVYQEPKDRHVFPWVDNLARFGRITRS